MERTGDAVSPLHPLQLAASPFLKGNMSSTSLCLSHLLSHIPTLCVCVCCVCVCVVCAHTHNTHTQRLNGGSDREREGAHELIIPYSVYQ